ncbi:sulfatase/phosphatase domain-containing protein [Streptomyces brevispora]|uniref:sulfatase/phosphatase domain-containing protein n=1 Tax=Streptomyces brevispora TaxID=887462 RepID=UPI00371119EE
MGAVHQRAVDDESATDPFRPAQIDGVNDKGPAMYEDIYRIPGIARIPGAPAQVSDDFASLIDLNPTILELAGAPVSDQCDGTSLLPLLNGAGSSDARDEIVAEFHGHHFPYSQRMLRDRRHKLVHNPESVHELYDLATDPHELHNVYDAPAYAEVRRDLTVRLYRELLRRGDPAYTWMSYMADIGGDRAPDVDGVAEEVARKHRPKLPRGSGKGARTRRTRRAGYSRRPPGTPGRRHGAPAGSPPRCSASHPPRWACSPGASSRTAASTASPDPSWWPAGRVNSSRTEPCSPARGPA